VRTSPDRDVEAGSLAAIAWRALPLLPLLAVGLAVLVPIGFVLKATEPSWDLDAIRWLADHRSPRLDDVTRAGTWLAETVPVLVLTLGAVAVARWRTHAWTWSAVIGLAVGCEKLVYLATTLIVRRDRPPVPTVGATYATSSFPSGHVGAAVTLYGGIVLALASWNHWRRGARVLGAVAVVLVAAFVGFCRMARGFHYPSDVVVGGVHGAAWLALAWWAFRRRTLPGERVPASGGSHDRGASVVAGAHDARLRCDPQQRPVAPPQQDAAVADRPPQRLRTHVEQHPVTVAGVAVDDPQGVVEARRARIHTEGVGDAERHDVGDEGLGGR
jgi:undecaprenyl-diphosphatase